MSRPDKIAITLLGALVATFLLLACSGANGDAPPAESEAGADATIIVITQCGDAATE